MAYLDSATPKLQVILFETGVAVWATAPQHKQTTTRE